MSKKICFVHYGIGWRDGINTVIKTLSVELQKQNPSLKICFLGGEIKEKILKNASYKVIPELLPKHELNKKRLIEKSVVIAKKLAKETKGMDVVVIENPFLGEYHLPAMLGYSLYARKYKPSGVKVFFRIHDFYRDFPKYYRNFQKLFSPKEIKKIINGRGVDGFLIINQVLQKKLSRIGIKKEKIFYLPNGVNGSLFAQPLSKKEKTLVFQSLKIPFEKYKILLYPVRVVPRKNIEEAILFTSFIRELTNENYVLVVAGKIEKNDPLSSDYYKMLKELTKAVDFPIIFTKQALPLEKIGDLYQISEAIIMTSIKEGFGYPFLECWFAKKIVLGRRIEEVISDFEKSKLDFGWLYPYFSIEKGKDLSEIQDKDFKQVKKIINIFKKPELKEKILKLNKVNLLKQIEILQNRDLKEKIIKTNLTQTKKVYDISNIAQRFSKITA